MYAWIGAHVVWGQGAEVFTLQVVMAVRGAPITEREGVDDVADVGRQEGEKGSAVVGRGGLLACEDGRGKGSYWDGDRAGSVMQDPGWMWLWWWSRRSYMGYSNWRDSD
jgi:hypothetical protein